MNTICLALSPALLFLLGPIVAETVHSWQRAGHTSLQLAGGQGAADAAAFSSVASLDKLPPILHSSSPTTHPLPALLAPTSPKGASNFPCLINPLLSPKGALSTPLANPD